MKLYGLCNNACFDFWNIVKLYGLCNNSCFEGSEGRKQGLKVDRKYPQTKLGYDSVDAKSTDKCTRSSSE